jgi:hypothetical protein
MSVLSWLTDRPQSTAHRFDGPPVDLTEPGWPADPECRFGPLHRCQTRDGQPLHPDQACFAWARRQLLEAEYAYGRPNRRTHQQPDNGRRRRAVDPSPQ